MDNMALLQRLSAFFPHAPAQELQKLIDISQFRVYAPKKVILEKNASRRKVFLVLKGLVRGYIIDPEGNERNILLRSQGIFVGDASTLFMGTPQRLTIASITDTELLLFNFEDFEQLALGSKTVLKIYLDSLKEAILRLSYRVDSMITMTNEERYVDLLEKNPDFLKDAYDKYIANFLGITPVSLSRIKKRLKRTSD